MEHTICIFGDSIAWGASDEEKSGWADRLKAFFFNEDSLFAKVYNLGIFYSMHKATNILHSLTLKEGENI